MKLGIKQSIANYLFSNNNLAPFRASSGLYGYIDKSGNIVIEPFFLCAGPFINDRAPVGLSISDDSKFIEIGYINAVGQVIVRQGDIYPISDNDFILPTFKNNYAITHSSLKGRNLPIGASGFPNPDLSTLPYMTSINDDGLSICYYEPVSGLPPRNVIVSNNHSGYTKVIIKGSDQEPIIPSMRDEIRQLLYTHSIPRSKFHFTNSDSDGIYIFESLDIGNYLVEFDKNANRFNQLNKVNEFQISQFINGNALYLNSNNDLVLVDKNLNTTSQPISFHGITENIEIGYNPQSNLVCVFAEINSQEQDNNSDTDSYLNVFDLISKKWKLENPIRRYFDVLPYSEAYENLLYYFDLTGPIGGPYEQKLHIKNLENKYNETVLDATDTRNGILCIEKADGEYSYINHDGDEILMFNA